MPSSAQRAWSPYSPDELSIMTVAPPSSGRFATSAATSNPSMSGMFASSRTSSNGRSRLRGRRERLDGGASARDDGRRHPPAPDLLGENAPVDLVVVDDQHVEVRRAGIGRLGLGRVGDVEGDGEMKRAAGARLALDPEPSAHQPHERGRDRQAEAGAAEPARRRSVRLTEGFEDGVVLLRRDADAGVGDAEVQLRAALGARVLPDGDEDVAALGELERVADQVRQDLLNPRRVADDAGRHVRVDVANELEPLLVRAEGERLERVRNRRRAARTAPLRARACAIRSSRSRGCRSGSTAACRPTSAPWRGCPAGRR